MPYIEIYLSPLCDYLNSISFDERKELRSYFGDGGYTRFWRKFQKVISEKKKDFVPDGLSSYWMNESKVYNEDAANYIENITRKLKDIIETKLEEEFGSEWLFKGLPQKTYMSASQEFLAAKYEKGDELENATMWDFVELADCRDIVIYSKNWSRLFADVLVRDVDVKTAGDKESKTSWISDVADIKRKMKGNAHYSVSVEQHLFLSSVFDWISQILVI